MASHTQTHRKCICAFQIPVIYSGRAGRAGRASFFFFFSQCHQGRSPEYSRLQTQNCSSTFSWFPWSCHPPWFGFIVRLLARWLQELPGFTSRPNNFHRKEIKGPPLPAFISWEEETFLRSPLVHFSHFAGPDWIISPSIFFPIC